MPSFVITPQTFRVPTPEGQLHIQRWQPPVMADKAPIVLLHDSLGCVALWRAFPAQLAAATAEDIAQQVLHPGTVAGHRPGGGSCAPCP